MMCSPAHLPDVTARPAVDRHDTSRRCSPQLRTSSDLSSLLSQDMCTHMSPTHTHHLCNFPTIISQLYNFMCICLPPTLLLSPCSTSALGRTEGLSEGMHPCMFELALARCAIHHVATPPPCSPSVGLPNFVKFYPILATIIHPSSHMSHISTVHRHCHHLTWQPLNWPPLACL